MIKYTGVILNKGYTIFLFNIYIQCLFIQCIFIQSILFGSKNLDFLNFLKPKKKRYFLQNNLTDQS